MVDLPPLRRLGHVAGVFVLVAAVALVGVTAVPQAVGADHSYVVLSGSMEPAIGAGDVVFVEEVPASAVAAGDVVTFVDRGTRTTHRVVEVLDGGDEPRFRTKGDANEEADAGVVSADQLVGEVTFTLPYVGHVVLFASSRLGLLGLVVVPAVLLGVSELWTLASGFRADDGNESTGGG